LLRFLPLVALASGCAGNYIEMEHASNIYCGPPPSFNAKCSETDFNSIGVGYRHQFDGGVYLDAKIFDRLPYANYELQGHGPHASFKAGYIIQ
jgi:hypothetical protein